jgi:hypothetical protein
MLRTCIYRKGGCGPFGPVWEQSVRHFVPQLEAQIVACKGGCVNKVTSRQAWAGGESQLVRTFTLLTTPDRQSRRLLLNNLRER